MYLNAWRAFRDGREIKDFIREQVNYNIISFTCESNIWYGGYSQIGSSQTHFEKEVSTELLKFKRSILVKPNHTSKDTPCVLDTVEKYSSPVKWHSIF